MSWNGHGLGVLDSVSRRDYVSVKSIASGVVLRAQRLRAACQGRYSEMHYY